MPGLSVTLPAPDLPPGPRAALVIATSTYEDSRLRRLRAPAQDAANLARVLADPALGGFELTMLRDSGIHNLRVGVEDFLADRKLEETVVVYLSCHGLLTAHRRLFFAATDTKKDRLAATGLDSRFLTECLDDCRARRQVVILDCCFSGAFARAKGSEDLELGERFGEAEQGRGRILLTASRATEYSFEGRALPADDASGSVFTAALLDGLRTGAADQDRDGLVSVSEAYAHAYARVRASGSAQTPQRWLYGGEGKEVVLCRSPAGITVEPAEIHEDLRAGLTSRYPQVRIGALGELAAWLTDPNPARAVAARNAMEEVAAEDIPMVAKAARAHLDKHPATPRAIAGNALSQAAQDVRERLSQTESRAGKAGLTLRYAVRSDVGLLREENEDSAYAGPAVLAVADGGSRPVAGGLATSLAIASMAKLDAEARGGDMLEELSSAIHTVNARMRAMVKANPAAEDMGSALTAMYWWDGHAATCHIGDTRGYLLREGNLYQITRDHTQVQTLVDEGRISVDDVPRHPQKDQVLHVLDGRSVPEPDLASHDSAAGDRYLLCTNGLPSVVSDEMLRETLISPESPEEVTRQLIELALRGGGPDNITCIVADVIGRTQSQGSTSQAPILAGAAAGLESPQDISWLRDLTKDR
jgi:serine/threonine protein phosphatase PrpC